VSLVAWDASSEETTSTILTHLAWRGRGFEHTTSRLQLKKNIELHVWLHNYIVGGMMQILRRYAANPKRNLELT